MTDNAPATRDNNGRFLPGQSGNPAGRAIGSKNHIVMLRENTELALREYLGSPASRKKAMKAIDRCMTIALNGEDKQALGAMKLLFDKLLPNASATADSEGAKQRPVAITIVNQTKESSGSPVTVIEGESVEI